MFFAEIHISLITGWTVYMENIKPEALTYRPTARRSIRRTEEFISFLQTFEPAIKCNKCNNQWFSVFPKITKIARFSANSLFPIFRKNLRFDCTMYFQITYQYCLTKCLYAKSCNLIGTAFD